jgi:hypothetical protein
LTGAMRVVVNFLLIQEDEWDVLYIRKGECPGPGWGALLCWTGATGVSPRTL